jgi:hypothetical protein
MFTYQELEEFIGKQTERRVTISTMGKYGKG